MTRWQLDQVRKRRAHQALRHVLPPLRRPRRNGESVSLGGPGHTVNLARSGQFVTKKVLAGQSGCQRFSHSTVALAMAPAVAGGSSLADALSRAATSCTAGSSPARKPGLSDAGR